MEFILNNIWYILIGLFLILGLGGGLLITTGYINRLLDWIRPNSDKYIKAKMLCEDKNIRDRRLKIGRYCISDDRKHRAFHLVHDLLINKGATQFLAISERSAYPIDFNNKLTEDERSKYPSATDVFIDTTGDIISDSAKENIQNTSMMVLAIIASLGGLAFVVMAIILFIQNRGA